jgi:hypothetical protein
MVSLFADFRSRIFNSSAIIILGAKAIAKDPPPIAFKNFFYPLLFTDKI